MPPCSQHKGNPNISAFRMTRRYSPLLGLTAISCGGFWPLSVAFIFEKRAFCALVTLSSNLSNIEKNASKNPFFLPEKIFKKFPTNPRKLRNPKTYNFLLNCHKKTCKNPLI